MKILVASMAADGHVNPLTGIAAHLVRRGHDVGWYTGPSYAGKLAKLGVTHLPFRRADDVNGQNLGERFPELSKLKGPSQISFALEKVFFGNLEAHYEDLCEIHARDFPFEAMLVDGALYATRLVREKLGVPWFVVMAAPTPTPVSRDVPPPFLGLKPASAPWRWVRDPIAWAMVDGSTRDGMKIMHALRAKLGLPPYRDSLWNLHSSMAERVFNVGAPEMDFPRSDWPSNVTFVGPLLPHKSESRPLPPELLERCERLERVVVVSQGTIDNRDPEKLIVPTIEAFRSRPELVVATTGGMHTDALRARFPWPNVMIFDYLDYDALMPRAALFVSNGGMGSVMHALVHGVPVVTAGTNEGKNDINARLAYRGIALDLATERPSAAAVAKAVDQVLGEPRFREAVARVQAVLATYDSFAIIERAIVASVGEQGARPQRAA